MNNGLSFLFQVSNNLKLFFFALFLGVADCRGDIAS